MECPVEDIRSTVVDLILHVLKCLLVYEETIVTEDSPSFKLSPTYSKLSSFIFIDFIFSMLVENISNWKHLKECLKLLHYFAKIGAVERLYLINKGVISTLTEKFINPSMQEGQLKWIDKLVSIIWILISGCTTKYSGKLPPPTLISGPRISLPSTELEKFMSKEFLIKCMKYNLNLPKLAKSLCHIMWENESISETIMKMILEELTKCDIKHFKNIFTVINILLLIEDQVQKKRVKVFCSTFLDTLNSRKEGKEYIGVCKESIKQLQSLADNNKEVTLWLRKNESKWNWIHRWYDKNRDYF